jgi:hypothetical protein
MHSFDSLPDESDEALFFRRLEAIDVSTVLPLVLFLFREKALSPKRRLRALKILESWLVRRALTRRTTTSKFQISSPRSPRIPSMPMM